MPDPRFKCQVAQAASQSAGRTFLQAANKVGNLAVLNSIGASTIGVGLRTLSSVSNSIRTGCGSLPTSIGNLVGDATSGVSTGASWVLGQVGISTSAVAAVANINPSIANAATGQAQQIYNQVKAGNFKATDIPSSIQDLQNFERLARNIYTSPVTTAAKAVSCDTTPYAMELAYFQAPKHKFMFAVTINFSASYAALKDLNRMTIGVKKSTRPTAKFITEDVNYYNFRTKVITKTENEEMKITFHDDDVDQALSFYNAYRTAISPISMIDTSSGIPNFTELGMDFTQALSASTPIDTPAVTTVIPASQYSASRGPLAGDETNVISSIVLYHLIHAGKDVDRFLFINPRIVELTMDEVDMSVGTEGNEISFAFNYDTVIIDSVPIEAVTHDGGVFIGQETAFYPLRNVTDSATVGPSRTPQAAAGNPAACGAPNQINTSS